MRVKDINVLITGGASGLGAASARAFVAAGAKVALADMSAENGQKMVEELGSKNAHFVQTDVTNEEQAKNCVE